MDRRAFRLIVLLVVACGACACIGCGSGGGGSDGPYEQNGGTASESAKTYAATGADEPAVHVYGGGSYSLTGGTLTKTGDTSSEDSSNFYGVNAIALAEDASAIELISCSLESDAEGANGAFAYEEGSSIYLEDCTITTHADSSRGVDATYGGAVEIRESTITTSGAHCAALASDRYEDCDPPEITAYKVTGNTSGEGSPGIYCTGTFVVDQCTLTATGSEAAGIEGSNSITLTDSALTGSVKWGVIVYQSTSGDSSTGTGTFSMTGGSLTNSSTGPDFMVCNTSAVIALEGVDITGGSSGVLLRACDADATEANVNTSWSGMGGEVTFTAKDQTLTGSISCDEVSTVDVTLSGTTTFTGAVLIETGGAVTVTLEGSSTWTATGTSYVAELEGVTFSGSTPTNVIGSGTIYYGSGTGLSGTYTLTGGGTLTPET